MGNLGLLTILLITWGVITVALVFLLLACGLPGPTATAILSPSPSSVATISAAASPTSSTRVALSVANSRYGKIIVDGSGRTLYLFDIERDHMPICNGACAVACSKRVPRAARLSSHAA